MATPAEKLANDIRSVTMVAEEQKWETEKLDLALEHLIRKYDLTGQYAREARQAQQELAAASKLAADDQRLLANILQKQVSNADLYADALAALNREQERGRITGEEFLRTQRELYNELVKAPAIARADARALQEKKIAEQEAAREAKELADAQQRLNAILSMGKTELDVYRERVQLLDRDYQNGLLTFSEYINASLMLKEQYITLPAQADRLREAERKKSAELAESAAMLSKVRQVQQTVSGENDAYIKSVNTLFDALGSGVIKLEEFQKTLAAVDDHYVKIIDSTDAVADRMFRLSQEAKGVNDAYKTLGMQTERTATAQDIYDEKLQSLLLLKQKTNMTDDVFISKLEEIRAGLLQSQIGFDKLTDKKREDAMITDFNRVKTEQLEKSIKDLTDKHNADAAASTRRIQTYMRLNKQVQDHANASREAARSLQGFISIYAAFATAKLGIKVASDMEQAEVAIGVLAGSAKEGTRIFSEIRKFAAESPISLEAAQKATKTLMQFGMSGDEAIEMLHMLGNASVGNEQMLEGLALAFGQSSAAGRLTGQELLQMVNQGFSPLQQMAQDMAKELGGLAEDHYPGLKRAMELGLITFEDTKNSLKSATSETGKYGGINEALAKTFGANYSKMVDSVKNLAKAIFDSLKPAMIESIKLVKELIDGLMSMFQPAETLSGTFGQLFGISVLAAGAIGTLIEITKAFGLVTKAMNVLLVIRNALMNPVALIGGLLIAAAAITTMNAATAAETAALEENADATDSAANSATSYANKLKNVTGIQNKSVSALEQKYIDIMKPLSAQLYALRHSAEATRDHELSMQGLLRDQRENVLEVEREIARLKEKREIEEMFADRAKRQLQTEREINQALSTGMLTRKEAATKLLELEDKRLERIKELADAGKSIQEKYNPVAKVAQQIAEMNVLLATGNITQEQYFAERNKLLFDNIKKLDMTQPEAMEAGSAQAAQFMQKMVVDEAEQQINELKAQTLLQQASLQAQQETNRRLADLKPVQLIR
jgi:tape measure domain-containing protein